jgi:Clostripain family
MSQNVKPDKAEPEKPLLEWTLMFFFGGDNELSPSMVSELKAIKDASFRQDTAVLAFFDPNEIGAPTRIYDVNRELKREAKAKAKKRGADDYPTDDDIDLSVRSLNEDNVDPQTLKAKAGEKNAGERLALISDRLKEPDTLDVKEALELFLCVCQENYRAKHYILFLVGHGMIVGNDAFLPDDHVIVKKAPRSRRGKAKAKKEKDDDERPITALSLKQLEEVVREFSKEANSKGGQFELLALHSCSMSAIEVVYQLKGTANYMMATEGISFVGSWPYRKLLKNTFNIIETAGDKAESDVVREVVSKLYELSLHNGTDFLSAGYSSELALCSLREDAVGKLKEPIQKLVKAMKLGLPDGSTDIKEQRNERVKELILLAHWKAQSYWQENYTDLFDFCLCLRNSCDLSDDLQGAISDACMDVMVELGRLVVHSDHYGSKYQYSHGLSIYFPWSRPVEDEANAILQRYDEYAFTSELADSSWLSFLTTYFKETQRETRATEDSERAIEAGGPIIQQENINEELKPAFNAAQAFVSPFGSLSRVKPSPELAGVKPSPEVGAACSCPTIKNYHEEGEIKIQGRKKCNVKTFSISRGALPPFKKLTPFKKKKL